ncbi:hypothetical protein [Serratia fonticola]
MENQASRLKTMSYDKFIVYEGFTIAPFARVAWPENGSLPSHPLVGEILKQLGVSQLPWILVVALDIIPHSSQTTATCGARYKEDNE